MRDEHYIIGLCDAVLGIPASRQHRFDFLLGDKCSRGRQRRLPVDAFYEPLRLAIEYRELQHTEVVAIMDKRMTISGCPRGEQRRRYDERRRTLLPRQCIQLTGDIKCFNSLGSCQDRVNFFNSPVSLRFCKASEHYPHKTIEAIPSLVGVSFTPAEISLGENLGVRAMVTATFKDHRYSDTGPGFDPYRTERDYDPFKQGTFWGKFRARNPFVTGRPLRVIRGYLGQTLEQMETRHYVMESFEGPRPDGTFTIIAQDILKLADNDRAQAPLSVVRLFGTPELLG